MMPSCMDKFLCMLLRTSPKKEMWRFVFFFLNTLEFYFQIFSCSVFGVVLSLKHKAGGALLFTAGLKSVGV